MHGIAVLFDGLFSILKSILEGYKFEVEKIGDTKKWR